MSIHPETSPRFPAIERLFAAHAVERTLPKGTILYLAGEPSGRVHFLERGLIVHMSRDVSGGETVLGLVGSREIVDATSAVEGTDHRSDAYATTTCHARSIDADRFRAALSTHASLALEMAHLLSARLRWLSDAAHERAAQGVSGRVAGRLLELGLMLGRHRDGSIDMDLPIDQAMLARLAATSRESTCKTLRRFKADGLVDYRGRQLRILRPDALARLRCAARRR